MKKYSAAFAALMVFLGLAMGQDKPYSCEFEKGSGTGIFQNVTLDAAWSAAVKVLMQNKFRITSSEKPSGMLIGERRPAAALNYVLTLYFEQDGTSIKILASVSPVKQAEGLDGLIQRSGWNKGAEKEERKFYDKLAAELYK